MNDYISQKERQYQNEIVKLFRERLDYEYLGSFQYPKTLRQEKTGRRIHR